MSRAEEDKLMEEFFKERRQERAEENGVRQEHKVKILRVVFQQLLEASCDSNAGICKNVLVAFMSLALILPITAFAGPPQRLARWCRSQFG